MSRHLVLKDLEKRGILKDTSNIEKFYKTDDESAVYAGFDPTADSLHLGNYIQIAILLRFKSYGWKVIGVLGGATGMIGDPSFRDSERQLLDSETLNKNKNKIRQQLEGFGIEVIDNFEFYKDMNFLTFLRDVGKLVNISTMINKDSVARRLEKGLSFTEFSYPLIQGWDFLQLYKKYNVRVQFGGSDQWGNITTGLEIISKVVGNDHEAFVFTSGLLTDENGNKFGKSTGGGSLWLDKERTKPFNMYQFLIKQTDTIVEKLLLWLTFLPIEKINEIMEIHDSNTSSQYAQKTLAYEVIKNIHGENEAIKSKTISEILYNKKLDLSSFDSNILSSLEKEIPLVEIKKDSNLIEQLINKSILKSKREAREFIQNKAIKFNLKPVNEDFVVYSEYFNNKYALLHVGKKIIYIVKIIF
ncbi:tyrosine--tRNA ligase [Mycoplasma sp. CSL10137]|uniref:tyrosine--tRNA ligase n=1 Tax=Mycoplasma sp. CSL10137 TaxID=2813824 RepID=UPI00197C9F22|nr:tyrosine--tRNA ligase [Mycoplasma sp. CSL10137]MBN4083474.1 tyrosine--tRNA ligase [Mycoplasma sp. CSL10137]